MEKVKQNEEVKRAYGRMFAYDVQVKNREEEYNVNLISYEENQFHWSEDSLVSGSIETVMQQEDQVLAVQSENADIQLGISWGIPFVPLGLIIMIVLCTSFLSVRNPAKRLQEMSIIENINTQ